MNASTISRQLRRAGFSPSHDRKREGVRVAASFEPGKVRVTADLDRPAEALRLRADLMDALIELGYEIKLTGEASVLVTGRRS